MRKQLVCRLLTYLLTLCHRCRDYKHQQYRSHHDYCYAVCFSCTYQPKDSAYTTVTFLVWCRTWPVLVSTVRHITTRQTSVLRPFSSDIDHVLCPSWCNYHPQMWRSNVASVCLSVVFGALTFESIDLQKHHVWYTDTSSEYIGHICMSRSSVQGQGHRSKMRNCVSCLGSTFSVP